MGECYGMKVQAVNASVEFAGAGARSSCSSGDSRESGGARHHSKRLEEDAHGWDPACNISTSCCSACCGSERKELENGRWTSSLRGRDDVVKASFGFVGSSFRSEDSEVLALWEEKSEKSPKAVSTDLSWLKPRLSVDSSHSPWRESVTNAVKMIESLSHVFSRSSPVHPKGDATLESPRPSLEYLMKADRRSSWRDFKIVSTSPSQSAETVLHNSPKARYSNASLCRVMGRQDHLLETAVSAASPGNQALRHAVSYGPERLQSGSSAPAARPADLRRPQVDEKAERSPWRVSHHEKRAQRNEMESELSCGQSPIQAERLPNQALGAVANSVEAGKAQTLPPRAMATPEETSNVRRSMAAAAPAERGSLSRQSTKISAEAVTSSMERCSPNNRTRSQSLDEAMLNVYASEPGVQQARAATLQEAGERKPSHRYYQRVTSRERSSRWSSCDETPLEYIDLVAPSAARFLEDEGCVDSPVKSPIKTPGSVPFKWEAEPGKPKDNSDSTTSAQCHSSLQLPPRLASRQQHSSPLRNRYIDKSISAPLAELYPRPSQKSLSSEAESMKVHLPGIDLPATCQKTAEENACPTSNLERGTRRNATIEPPFAKSRSARDFRSMGASLQTLSRLSPRGEVGDRNLQCTDNARQRDHEQKPAHPNSGVVRSTSPTSILCGPGDGSHPSSNPSLSSEHEAPQIPPAGAASSAMSHSSMPSYASFDSMEHSIEHSSELVSPDSSLTSPLHANTRCNSMSYNDNIDHMRKYASADCQKGATSHNENAFVKLCKTGRRWMSKTKVHSKLGTIYSPEVWTPGMAVQVPRGVTNSDFSDRLAGGMSTSTVVHRHIQSESRFGPSASPLPQEDIGDRSPAYAATLELLSPVAKPSSKSRQAKPPPRQTRKTTSGLRVRARVRARFLVPMRRILRTLFSTFRRRNKGVKAAGSLKPLYHVDYTLSQREF